MLFNLIPLLELDGYFMLVDCGGFSLAFSIFVIVSAILSWQFRLRPDPVELPELG